MMNVPPMLGMRVINDHPDLGFTFDREQNKRYLTFRETYTILTTKITPDRTMIYFVELPAIAFNSVQFTELPIIPDPADAWRRFIDFGENDFNERRKRI